MFIVWVMNVYFHRYLSSSEKGQKNSCLNRDLNPDICDAGTELYQLIYQANWELVIIWVDDKPIDYGYRFVYVMSIHEFCVLEVQIEVNVYDPCSF